MLARKAVLKNTGLKPQATGGKLYLPGFHRTRQESAAASIVVDSLKTDKLSGTSLYGRGFYMARSFTNQKRKSMMFNYGKHLVRCRVDVSRFICFDKAAAKRVWGDDYLLKDQLANFGPWSRDEQKKIDAYSHALAAFWINKKSPDAVYKRQGHYSRPGSKKKVTKPPTRVKIRATADIARLAYQDLKINTRVPGILYTGSSDGACVLAYHLDRVTPLATALVDKIGKFTVNDIAWVDATDRKIKRKYAPDLAMKDDIETYRQRLTMTGRRMTVAEKTALIQTSFDQLPADPHDKLAFSLALLRVCRHVSLHDIRDHVLEQFAESLTRMLHIDMPYFAYTTKEGINYKSRYMRKDMRVISLWGDEEDEEDDDSETLSEKRKIAQKYMALLKRHDVLWDFIRYQVFLSIDRQHRAFLKEIIPILEDRIKHPYVENLNVLMGGLFGAKISEYGEIVDGIHPSYPKTWKSAKMRDVEGILFLKAVMSGHCRADGYFFSKPRSVPPVYGLIGIEEYVQFMRSQILKLYGYLKAHPVIGKDKNIAKILNTWHRKYGRHHKAAVKAYPAFHNIGGQTLEPTP